MMFCDIFHLHRTERSKPHMQSDIGKPYPFFFDLFQQFLCKMQPCCRRRRRPFVFGVYGLIPVLILQLMSDVRRQRHLSQLVQHFLKNPVKLELHETVSFVHNVRNLTDKFPLSKRNSRPRLRLPSRFYKCFPRIVLFSF